MRYLMILGVCVALCGCSAIETIKSGVEKLDKGIEKGNQILETAQTTLAEARAEADTNKDGNVSRDEWVKWLLGAVTAAVGGGGAMLSRRNSESAKLKAVMAARIEALEKKAG